MNRPARQRIRDQISAAISYVSWSTALLLGLHDMFPEVRCEVMQVLPTLRAPSVDTPDLGRPWSNRPDPIWRWLFEAWNLEVPESSRAITNVATLEGEAVTEGARWGDSEWELFAGAGPDVQAEDVRIVPLATLLGADETLSAFTEVAVGDGLWRMDRSSPWNEWTRSTTEPGEA